MEEESNNIHFNLYKNRNNKNIKQSTRRKQLLEEQKNARNLGSDENRFQFIKKFTCNSNKKFNPFCKDKLQFSDWFLEKPDDLEEWLLVPCPKGKRCLLVAKDGITTVYNKNGFSIKRFHSKLPGDRSVQGAITIFDAIFINQSNQFYILDVLSYGVQEMIHCTALFRLFWCKSKINELELSEVSANNQISINTIPYYQFSDENEIIECFSKFPIFNNNIPILDGFLFYHREASYVNGITPLVGWLFPFMIEEFFGYNFINDNYKQFPKNYNNFMEYIEKFNAKQKKRIKKLNMIQINDVELAEEDIENYLEEISPQMDEGTEDFTEEEISFDEIDKEVFV